MFLSEQEYVHAANILAGLVDKEPILIEFTGWFDEIFALRIYDYICDVTSNGRIRLRVLLWNSDCQRKLMDGANLDLKKQAVIARQFSELCMKYHVHKDYQKAENIFVCYETLEDEIKKRVVKQAQFEIQSIHRQDVWKIEILFECIHIFFETDEQIICHQNDGVCEAVNSEIANILRKYDRFGVFASGIQCIFTSRQTLEEKYAGNMYYYFL